MDFTQMIDSAPNIEGIARALDLVSHETRLRSVVDLGKHDLSVLYEASSESDPIEPDDLVPCELQPGATVILDGKDSSRWLPRFVRQLWRPADHEPLRGFDALAAPPGLGALVTQSLEARREGGHLMFDRLARPWWLTWPAHRGDCERIHRLSRHVLVGRDHRGSVPIDRWFVLVRREE